MADRVGQKAPPTGKKPQTINTERRIAALAARQHGNITRRQLMDLGLGRRAIAHRLAVGWLHQVHRGVYAVGHPPGSPLARASAALLACGPEAALSGRSALALWELGPWPSQVEVSTPQDRRRPGILVRHIETLSSDDLTHHHRGLRVTSPTRTLLDVARLLDTRLLTRAVNEAVRRRLVRVDGLTDLLSRTRGQAGAARLRAVVSAGAGPTRSEFEDRFLAFCRRHRLPRPQVNVRVAGHEADAFFETARLIVELDGWDFHSSRLAFERDRERDATALAAGIGTYRITWPRLIERPAREAHRLRRVLRAREAERLDRRRARAQDR